MSEVGEACGAGKVCPDCKPALTYIVASMNAERHKEERHARLINDRVHGNIQNDGTFSIVPRTRGGVTNPDELRRIADVAEKYNARMVKITGSQRLDILGVKKEDLPKAYADLGMPSGHAYTKAFRQVKTCVGTEFCRFGVGDSTNLGIDLEKTFENLYAPAKVKMGASGCPRNCAEASVKDVGVIAVEGGWQIYIGGAAGMDVRKGDVIATVEGKEEAKKGGGGGGGGSSKPFSSITARTASPKNAPTTSCRGWAWTTSKPSFWTKTQASRSGCGNACARPRRRRATRGWSVTTT